MNKRRVIFIPLVILGYFFLHFGFDYFYFITFRIFCTRLLQYLLVTGLLYAIGYKIFKDREKFTLAFSAIFFFFLFYGSFTDIAAMYRLFNANSASYARQALVFSTVCLVIMVVTKFLPNPQVRKLLLFWLIYCGALVVYDTGTFILLPKKEKKFLQPGQQFDISKGTVTPNIFFLIFDMYPSDSVLHTYFNFDNSGLNSFLNQEGFYVTGNAHSSYHETYYSLSSTLNLDTLHYFNDPSIDNYKKVLIALQNTRRTELLSAFERAGYTFHNYSVFNLQGQTSPLRFNLSYHLDNVLTGTTFFNRIYNEAEPDFLLAEKNIDLRFVKTPWSVKVKKDMLTLDNDLERLLDTLPKTGKPSFSYFHFMIPHPPLLYDSNGEENNVKDMYFFKGRQKGIEKYTSYARYGNKKIIDMVEKIFLKAGRNVIIIIQGDHGFREFYADFPDAVRYGILNSVYLPNKNYTNFNDTMNPVFTFKQILLNQFNTVLP